MDKGLIRFHHGAFFKGLLSTVGFGIVIVCAAACIYMLDEKAWISAAVLAGMASLGLELARGVRGVEVDLRKREVYRYCKIFAFKFGSRVSLDRFDHLALTRVRGRNLSNNFNASTANGLGGAMGHTVQIRFEIALRDVQHNLSVYLKEFNSPREAQIFLHQLAERMGLKGVDEYQRQVDALQHRRTSVDARSRRRR